MNYTVYSILDNSLFVLLILLLFFGLIALLVYIIRKKVPAFRDDIKPTDEAKQVQEELDRVLVEYKEEKKKDDNSDEE
ncbi:MAG TPA: hypothetical protein PKC96_04510 [Bacilli bacterium]|nr:hypothetical protein [Bacilli bacterium]